MRLDLTVVAATDLGRKRPQNEDSYAVLIPEDESERERHGTLLVVADGMGGSLSGEVASRLAVETVVHAMEQSRGADMIADLRHAIESANRVVHEKSLSDPELNGMGTTCTVVVIRDDYAWVAHVGDSRAYLVRGERIRQLTQDHSLVARLIERKEITREQARRDPRRNIVTRSIGAANEVEADVFKADIRLRAGDAILVCSDGLHGQFRDLELAEIIANGETDTLCDQLIAEANDRGGPDNITVVVAQLRNPWDAETQTDVDEVREA